MTALPAGWATGSLKSLGRWVGGGTPSKQIAAFWSGEIPWVSPKDMKVTRIRDTVDHITAEAVARSATTLVPSGAVLVVTRSGILRHSLPVAIADREVAINQDMKALVAGERVVPGYVAWALRAFAQEILHNCAKAGTTVQNLDTAKLLDFPIPIAPSAEQYRIVAAIELQMSRLDALSSHLELLVGRFERGKGRLGALRRSILDSAFAGKLVVQDPSDESASVLLDRIATEKAAQPMLLRRKGVSA